MDFPSTKFSRFNFRGWCTYIQFASSILTAPTASNMSKDDWKVDLMASESATYCFQAMVRGYHVYRDTWVAGVGEELSCVRETDNHQRVSSSSWCYNAKYFEGRG